MNKRANTFFSVLGLVILVSLPIIAIAKLQSIEDWAKLYNYNPPVAVSTLATQDTMTPRAIHDFYVNHPSLMQDTNTFNQECLQAEQAIVLGCYHPNQNGIFIHVVNDPRLNGIEEVTAAHEMLHAAYDRLSSSDKKYVDGLLEDYYKNGLTDQRIQSEINEYKKSEPTQVVNEMHSVFGTEAANLPAPLEAYYKQYFGSRSVVVGFANSYQGEFTTRVAEIDADDAKLNDLKNQISSEEASLKSQLTQINGDRAKLDEERASGQISQYNSDVPGFNTEVDSYNHGVSQLQSDIASYNQLVIDRNSIASELRSLDSAIDTRLTTQTAQ